MKQSASGISYKLKLIIKDIIFMKLCTGLKDCLFIRQSCNFIKQNIYKLKKTFVAL